MDGLWTHQNLIVNIWLFSFLQYSGLASSCLTKITSDKRLRGVVPFPRGKDIGQGIAHFVDIENIW